MPHDPGDDLESFFYVLCWICCGYSGPGHQLEATPKRFFAWESEDAQRALDSKIVFFSKEFKKYSLPVAPYFGKVFHDLIVDLHTYFRTTTNRDEKESQPTVFQMDTAALAAYTKVVGSFDTAIKNLTEQPTEGLE